MDACTQGSLQKEGGVAEPTIFIGRRIFLLGSDFHFLPVFLRFGLFFTAVAKTDKGKAALY